MTKNYNFGTGAATDEAPEQPADPATDPQTDPAADADARFAAVCQHFGAETFTATETESGATSFTLLDAEQNPLAVGTLIELEGFVTDGVSGSVENTNPETSEGDNNGDNAPAGTPETENTPPA